MDMAEAGMRVAGMIPIGIAIVIMAHAGAGIVIITGDLPGVGIMSHDRILNKEILVNTCFLHCILHSEPVKDVLPGMT